MKINDLDKYKLPAYQHYSDRRSNYAYVYPEIYDWPVYDDDVNLTNLVSLTKTMQTTPDLKSWPNLYVFKFFKDGQLYGFIANLLSVDSPYGWQSRWIKELAEEVKVVVKWQKLADGDWTYQEPTEYISRELTNEVWKLV
jgi:hypothetical protein